MARVVYRRAGMLVAVGVLLLGLPLSPVGVAAQNTDGASTPTVKGVTISPPLKEVILGPGLVEAKTTVTLKNTTGKDLIAKIRLVDFKSLDEFGGVSLSEVGQSTEKYSLAPWMSLGGASDSLPVPNGQTVTIPVSIANRTDLAPGGHYGAVIASLSETGQGGSNTVQLKQELVSLLFVKKLGGEVYGLELASVKGVRAPAIPDEITVRFKSTGNVHVVPRGYIEVTDPKGQVISKGIINPESTMVMPGTTRQFVTLLQSVSQPKRYGRYTVTVYYRHDGQKDFVSQSISLQHGRFSPTFLMGVLVGGLLVLGGGVWFLRWRKKGRYHLQ